VIILITGAAGNLGGLLARHLLSSGHERSNTLPPAVSAIHGIYHARADEPGVRPFDVVTLYVGRNFSCANMRGRHG